VVSSRYWLPVVVCMDDGGLKMAKSLKTLGCLLVAVGCVTTSWVAAAERDLAAEARDPTASVLSLQMQYWHTAKFHGMSGADQGTLVLRPVIPYKLGEQAHISRVTLPVVTHGPDVDSAADPEDTLGNPPPAYVPTVDEGGLTDITWLDLFIYPFSKGRWGIGPVVVLPTATDDALGAGKWQVGPAGVVIAKAGNLQYGCLSQWFFSVAGDDDRADINLFSLQPFASYGLKNGWSVGTSDMSYNYDFENDRWSSLGLGARLEKLVMLGKYPTRLYGEVEYNFADDAIGPEVTYRFNIAPLLPMKK
jgi:hypothetical protein